MASRLVTGNSQAMESGASATFGSTFTARPIVATCSLGIAAMAGSGPPASLERAAIVGVGAIMAVKWSIAWLSELPRSRWVVRR